MSPKSDQLDDRTQRWRSIQEIATKSGPLIALLVLIGIFSFTNDKFFTTGNLRTIADQSAILVVIALGMTFIILIGSIDLSPPGVMAGASMVFVLLAENNRNDNDLGLAAIVVALAFGALIGATNGVLNSVFKIPSFMATLGTGAVGLGIATLLYKTSTPRLLDEGMRAIGIGRTLGVSHLVIIAVFCTLLFWWLQSSTRIGRNLFVIGSSEEIARTSGVPIRMYKIITFMIAGVMFALAGVLAATQVGVGSVEIGSGQEFAAITAVVVGGTLLQGGSGGVLRTIVGAFIMSVLANGLILAGVSQYVQPGVQGAVIVAAIALSGWKMRTRMRVVK